MSDSESFANADGATFPATTTDNPKWGRVSRPVKAFAAQAKSEGERTRIGGESCPSTESFPLIFLHI